MGKTTAEIALIVKALRACSQPVMACTACAYFDRPNCCDQMLNDAADAIEQLLADGTEEITKDLYKQWALEVLLAISQGEDEVRCLKS